MAAIGPVTAAQRAVAKAQGNGAAPAARRIRWASDVVDEIRARAGESWVPLSIDAQEIVTVRPGGIATIVGGTGSGKTSLGLDLSRELVGRHVASDGLAVLMTAELPADEAVARVIGMVCDESWAGVLRGRVPEHEMRRAAALRLAVIDRADATLGVLDLELAALRAQHPAAPILVVIDYVQIIASAEAEMRMRVDDVMRRIDASARKHRVVAIVVSQSSRHGARALKSGEATGADTTDLGAESAAIERWASVTLAIGAAGPEREDGTRPVSIAIGKCRMGGGDREQAATYNGRNGRWRLDGEARPAAEVRAERQASATSARQQAAELAMAAFAERAKEPVTKADLIRAAAIGKGGAAIGDAAVAALRERGEIVEVPGRARSRYPRLWTPARVAARVAELGGSQ